MVQPPTSSQPQGPKNDKPSFSSGSKNDLLNYFKEHARETISYVLLITGILLISSWPLYGGLLVGIIAGIYFGDEIINYIKSWKSMVSYGLNYPLAAKHIVLLGIAIAFFISAPAIFLGTAVSIGIKQLFVG